MKNTPSCGINSKCVLNNSTRPAESVIEYLLGSGVLSSRMRAHEISLEGKRLIAHGNIRKRAQLLAKTTLGGKLKLSVAKRRPMLLLENMPPSLFRPYDPVSIAMKRKL